MRSRSRDVAGEWPGHRHGYNAEATGSSPAFAGEDGRPLPRHLIACPIEQNGIGVERENLALDDAGQRRGEISIATAKVEHRHFQSYSECAQNGVGIAKHRRPPIPARHPRAREEQSIRHRSPPCPQCIGRFPRLSALIAYPPIFAMPCRSAAHRWRKNDPNKSQCSIELVRWNRGYGPLRQGISTTNTSFAYIVYHTRPSSGLRATRLNLPHSLHE